MTIPKWLTSSIKFIGSFLEVFSGLVVLYITIAVYGAVIPVGELKDKGDVIIYVQSNGVHTSICLPVKNEYVDWESIVPFAPYGENTQFEYAAIGWGDKGFFLNTPTWAELKASTAVNAVFLPSSAAMHVEYMSTPIEDENSVRVYIDKTEYIELAAFIENSFLKNELGVELIPEQGYTDHDNFYEAKGSYHLFNTCNTWTNKALKEGHIKTAILALFPNGILPHLKE